MGTAVGFALGSGSAREIFGIFMGLGLGMVIPYLSIALFPDVAIFLPKPGKWMLRLRFLLGVALALTAAWLLWVLSAQIIWYYALTVAACMMGVVAMLGIYTAGVAQKTAVFALAGFVAIAVALSLGGAPPPNPESKIDKLWQPFDQTAIPIQVSSGRTVFVDITADWCLTCKANKRFVLSDDDITERIFHSDVIAMRGDWTNPDAEITSFLHKYRRFGIPFNIVYGPGAPQGITLPEILSHDAVIEALNKASNH
jgi:suppressor for copper-sensitivity B